MNLSTVVTMAIAGLEVSITKENSQTKCERELIGSKFIQGFSNNVENSLWRSLRAYTVTQRLERELSLRGSCRIMCRIIMSNHVSHDGYCVTCYVPFGVKIRERISIRL